jgi:hypothetical protein
MATASAAAVPGWFRVVSVLALGWNAIGVFMYLSSVGVFGDPMAGLSAGERAAAESIPAWITGAFAVGTFTGLAGAIGLVMRRAWALPTLIVSLVALVILEGWILLNADVRAVMGIGVPVMVITGAVLIAWLASHAKGRGWLA